jgi:hypothetical protein
MNLSVIDLGTILVALKHAAADAEKRIKKEPYMEARKREYLDLINRVQAETDKRLEKI